MLGKRYLKNLINNSFIRELYESFVRVRGVPIAFISLLLGFLYFYLSANSSSVQLKVILPVIVVLLILIITLFDLSYRLFSKSVHRLPRVKQARKPPLSHSKATAILLLENSEVYGHETIVSIYYIENGFEVFIGIGFVFTHQDNGYIQILVGSEIESAYKETWERVCHNDLNVLSNLLVKPSMPKGMLHE